MRITLALVVLLLSGCYCYNTSPGEGEKIGQVVKISKVGMIGVTWEAQLIRGGMSSGSGSFGVQPFDFTIAGDSLAKVITGYMNNQTEIKIRYRTKGVYSAFSSESDGHFLLSAEPVLGHP